MTRGEFEALVERAVRGLPKKFRQKIANISVFVLSQTAALQMSPQFDHFRPLIEINRNIAAGLSGRP